MLGPRLSLIRSLYTDEETVWDIGCDHGKLGLSFLNEEKVRQIHLVDPSEKVISTLTNHVDSYITDPFKKIHIHMKNGQEILPDSSKKIVFIAGMGGKEIGSILDYLESVLFPLDNVVISPHRDILALRDKLHHSVFSLREERLCLDEGRFYQILALCLTGGRKVPLFGEEIFHGEVGEAYRTHQLATFTAHQDERSRSYVSYLKGLTQCF